MADFLPAFEATLLREGGYRLTNVTGDRGKQTYAGISRRWWPNWHGWQAVDAGGEPDAKHVRAFYKLNFWDALSLDEVANQRIAESIYDFGVNADPKVAAKLAQIVVGVTPDGRFGPVTLQALNAIDPAVFIPAFTLAKIARYRDIVSKDRTQLKFLLGWLNRALQGVA